MRRSQPRPARGWAALPVTAVMCALLLSACAAGVPPVPSGSASSAPPAPSASPTPSPTASPTGVDPTAPASQNLAAFQRVVDRVWRSKNRDSGRAYVDALTEAGFDKERMEVTRDRSTVGNPAESLQFSVEIGDECLVGQVGPSTQRPVAVVLPTLPEGGCLVGETRPITW